VTRRLVALLALGTLVLVAVLLWPLGLLTGGDDKKEAEQTVRDFVEATNEKDADKLCNELLTKDFIERATGASGDNADEACKQQFEVITGLELALVRIRKTEVDGDEAEVTAELKAQGQRRIQFLRLEKEDGDWRLAGSSSR
jgi:predicted lipid-binding transport protein (Tim44 family)